VGQVGIAELLEAGVHFGHQTRRWNPKMRRFIYGERGGVYIIDLLKTSALLAQAQAFASDLAYRGGTVLFVGTKKQARDTIRDVAAAAGMPYVNHRWLGGLLTNFQTINLRIRRLHDLERYEAEGQLELLPTRERMAAQADLAKLRANLGGVKDMQRVPDAMFVIDLKTELIAVREAQRLRIPIIGVVDTNCDPDGIDYVIPGNDDAIRSCALLTQAIGQVVSEGHSVFRAEEQRAREEAAEKARLEAEARARQEAEEQAKREAEEHARAAEEQASAERATAPVTPQPAAASEAAGAAPAPAPPTPAEPAHAPAAPVSDAASEPGPPEPAPPEAAQAPEPAPTEPAPPARESAAEPAQAQAPPPAGEAAAAPSVAETAPLSDTPAEPADAEPATAQEPTAEAAPADAVASEAEATDAEAEATKAPPKKARARKAQPKKEAQPKKARSRKAPAEPASNGTESAAAPDGDPTGDPSQAQATPTEDVEHAGEPAAEGGSS
jgi:small subunit ribosomal protein S2